ncbi:hypothetical protein CBM2621_P160004 [Cupriavidus taiwanensis]|nr:hypothetical protein CBM2621_P160004 [Cupriavidus taiwanensis]
MPPMLTQEQAVEIRVLAKRGAGVREIAPADGSVAQHGAALFGPRTRGSVQAA